MKTFHLTELPDGIPLHGNNAIDAKVVSYLEQLARVLRVVFVIALEIIQTRLLTLHQITNTKHLPRILYLPHFRVG